MDGFLYIYVANETNTNQEVYFDDLKITHESSTANFKVSQINDFYPFGMMTTNSWRNDGYLDPGLLYQSSYASYDSLTGYYDFLSRSYDPQLGRFFAMDPAGQFSSPYAGMGNMPMLGVDPDGEFVFLIAAVIGGVVNLTVNAVQGNLGGDGLWAGIGKGFAAFGSGAAAGALALTGPAGWAAGGAILGGTNAWLGGAQGLDIVKGAAIGAVSGLAGGGLGRAIAPGISAATSSIASPALQGAAAGAIGGAATGAVLGGVGASINGGNFWEGAGKGALTGAVTGGIAGGASASLMAHSRGYNPLTGNRTKAWLQNNAPTNLQPKTLDLVAPKTNAPKLIRLQPPANGSSNPSGQGSMNTRIGSSDFGGKRQFVTSFKGETIEIPAGYYAARAENGNGVVYRPNGSTSNANSIRIMGPTPRYPNGYVRFYNNQGQPINFYTGKTGPNPETHYRLK